MNIKFNFSNYNSYVINQRLDLNANSNMGHDKKNLSAGLENQAGIAFSQWCRPGMWAQALGTVTKSGHLLGQVSQRPAGVNPCRSEGIRDAGVPGKYIDILYKYKADFRLCFRGGDGCPVKVQPAWHLPVLKEAKISQLESNSFTWSVEGPEWVHGRKIHPRLPKKDPGEGKLLPAGKYSWKVHSVLILDIGLTL